MVFFKDVTVSGKTYLVILDNENQHMEKGTRLRVHETLVGQFADDWPKLVNHLHQNGWTHQLEVSKAPTVWTLQSTHHHLSDEISTLSTLKRRFVTDQAKWGDDVQFVGEFRYFKGYWEWTEDILSRYRTDLSRAGIYDAIFASLFTYDRNTEIVKAFCESWCPATNTLLTSLGEMSISLWDVHNLSGLPLCGKLYDDVVPCAKELLGDRDGTLHMPSSCRYLFHAYHFLRGQSSSVSVEAWIKFWSRSKIRYQKPPMRKEKKTVRPKSTHNPTGCFKAHETRTAADKIPFQKLDIKEKYWHQTFLAAYLSCWLCTFVLPEGDADLIRPNTFKMASIMAYQEKVSLTVPVLASIYKGLNAISTSIDPIQIQTALPFHFIYGWLAYYFKTHFSSTLKMRVPRMIYYSGEGGAMYYNSIEARTRLHRWDQMSWKCMMISESENIWYVDGGNAVESHRSFFVAIRSNYLAKRVGDNFILEPYSPHRFSRQFGYYQVLPGVLDKDIREASLDVGLTYWRICMSSDSPSKACFPSWTLSSKKLSSTSYKDWWAVVHRSFSDEHITPLTPPIVTDVVENKERAKKIDPLIKRKISLNLVDEPNSVSSNVERHWKRQKKHEQPIEDHSESSHRLAIVSTAEVVEECFGTNDLEYSHNSSQSKQSLPPFAKPVKAKPPPGIGDVSEFNGKNLYDDYRNTFLKDFWGALQRKISRTPVDFISSIKDDILDGILGIRHHAFGYDLSSLEESVDTLFARAAAYDKARSASYESAEHSAQRLKEVKSSICDAKAKKKEETNQIKSLKQELAELEIQKERLSKSIQEHQTSHKTTQDNIKELENELVELKDTFGDEASAKVESSRTLLESAREALEDQDPFV